MVKFVNSFRGALFISIGCLFLVTPSPNAAKGLESREISSTARIDKIRLYPQTKAQYLKVFGGELDVVEHHNDNFVVFATIEQQDALRHEGFQFVLEQTDIAGFYQGRYERDLKSMKEQMVPNATTTESATMGGFKTLSEIEAHLDAQSAAHPTIMTPKFAIGTSIELRSQWVVKISDNPGVDEDEPEIFIVSLIHAREPCAAAATLNVMDYLLSQYGIIPAITDLVNTREIFFLPVQNPDGYAHNEATNPSGSGLWRKNRRNNGDATFGVDLNRNYDGEWGFDDLGSSPATNNETYRGTAAFSEPETQSVSDFVNARQFSIIHNNHTYGDLVLWPWGYNRIFSYEQDTYQAIGDSMSSANGYTAAIGWNLYPVNGDADDWGFSKLAPDGNPIISLTTETGSSSDGFWPSPINITALVAENLNPNLYLISIADNPYKAGPPKTPSISAPLNIAADSFTVAWNLVDANNPAVSYQLRELTGKTRLMDFAESDLGYWSKIRFAQSSTRKKAGSFSWKTQAINRGHHWLQSVTPVAVTASDTLKFWMWYNIETGWDYFYVQISTDGGYLFNNIAIAGLTTNTNPENQNLGNGITGAGPGAGLDVVVPLAAYAGQQVIFRFAYFTDGGVLNEGVYLDNINMVDLFASDVAVGPYAPGTSQYFSGKANGDYFYRVQAKDAEGDIGRLSNIAPVTVNTPPPYLCGDADGSSDVTIGDAVYLISYIFLGGPAPSPLLSADADGDSNVTIGDAVYLIAYIFSGGAAPICEP